MRILGIDPGLRHTGWGIIESHDNRLSYVDCGTIHPSDKIPLADRLACLHYELDAVIVRHQPQQFAIEETFVNKNALSSLKLGHARGVLMLTASLHKLAVGEYAATLVKKSIVGTGRAEKHQMQMMIKQLLPQAQTDSEDSADALAVAICHAHHA